MSDILIPRFVLSKTYAVQPHSKFRAESMTSRISRRQWAFLLTDNDAHCLVTLDTDKYVGDGRTIHGSARIDLHTEELDINSITVLKSHVIRKVGEIIVVQILFYARSDDAEFQIECTSSGQGPS